MLNGSSYAACTINGIDYRTSADTSGTYISAYNIRSLGVGVEDDVTTCDVTSITDMSGLFQSRSGFNQDISAWDVSQVRDMNHMFSGATSFNQDISAWDVSQVRDMNHMFSGATSFNQDIPAWDVSQVVDMSYMFYQAESFNGSLSNWSVVRVEDMGSMFRRAKSFNQDLGSWTLGSVKIMDSMFSQTDVFNGDISTWDTSSVVSMVHMFSNAMAFNRSLNNWNVGKVSSMEGMFYNAVSFNQSINKWPVDSVTNMARMFFGATAFNQSLYDWQDRVDSVTTMNHMFYKAAAFNGDMRGWQTVNVTDMESMFDQAISFNRDLSGWQTGKVTTMKRMFAGVPRFNRDLSSWEVGNVTDMSYMFYDASSFNGELESWQVNNVLDMRRMFSGTGAFNQDISAWRPSKVITMFEMFGNAKLFNQNLSGWDVAQVKDMSYMFYAAEAFNSPVFAITNATNDTRFMFHGAQSFNQDLDHWDVSGVTDMSGMFSGASAFNGNVANWTTNQTIDMGHMFSGARTFNQDLSEWNVSNVLDMSNMFSGVTIDTINYNNMLIAWSAQDLQSGVSFNAGYSRYSIGGEAQSARDNIISQGWEITDSGGISAPTVVMFVPLIKDPFELNQYLYDLEHSSKPNYLKLGDTIIIGASVGIDYTLQRGGQMTATLNNGERVLLSSNPIDVIDEDTYSQFYSHALIGTYQVGHKTSEAVNGLKIVDFELNPDAPVIDSSGIEMTGTDMPPDHMDLSRYQWFIDPIIPKANISYKINGQPNDGSKLVINPGDALRIIAAFDEPISSTHVPQISGSGADSFEAVDMSLDTEDHTSATYYYDWKADSFNTETQSFSITGAQDLAGNETEPILIPNINLNLDNTAPSITIQVDGIDNMGDVSDQLSVLVNFEISELTANFVADDIEVDNGQLSGFDGSGQSYVASITPTQQGEVSITIVEGAFSDTAGNINARTTFHWMYLANPANKADVVGLIKAWRNSAYRWADANMSAVDYRLSWLDRHQGNANTSNQGIKLNFGNEIIDELMYGAPRTKAAIAADLNNLGLSAHQVMSLLETPKDALLASSEQIKSGAQKITINELARLRTQALGSLNPSFEPVLGDWSFWSAGEISLGKTQAQADNDEQVFDEQSLSFGLDKPIESGGLIGVALSLGKSKTKIGTSGSTTRADNYALSTYQMFKPKELMAIETLVGLGRLNFDITRTDGTDTLSGKRQADQAFVAITLKEQNLDKGNWSLYPYTKASHVYTQLKPFSESGGVSALTYQTQDISQTKLYLGADMHYRLSIDNGKLRPFVNLEYGADISKSSSANMYYNIDSQIYTLELDQSASSNWKLGLGADLSTKGGWLGSLNYQREQDSEKNYRDSLNLNMQFKF